MESLLDILAQSTSLEVPATPLMFVSSAMVGFAVFLAVSTVWNVLAYEPDDVHTRGDELGRRQTLRTADDQYKKFELMVDELALEFGRSSAKELEAYRVDISLATPLPWRPAEYRALATVKGMLVGLMLFCLLIFFLSPIMSVVVSAALGWFVFFSESRRIAQAATLRRLRFKKRLPFAVDLMALMLQAGAVFVEALRAVTKESRNHPLGDELQKVLSETEMGRPRREALESLDHRVADPDLSELVFAVNRGEELGTKLSDIFSNMAEQMRLKRSQWAEKAAGQAQVAIVFPGMLTMLSCLLVVTAPFVLKAIYSIQN